LFPPEDLLSGDEAMTTLWHDVRYSLRMLARSPALTALTVMTLALGMAGNTMIFSFFNAFFLRPMPFHEPDRLVDLDETAPRWNLEYTGLAYPDFDSWRQRNRSFDGMAAWTLDSFNLSFEGTAQRVRGARVTHDLTSVLGIKPARGRPFTAEEDRPGGEKVVLVTAVLGALPTCQAVIKGSFQGALTSSGRQSTGTPAKRRGLHALVVGEVALTLLLLIQAGLLVQAFRSVQKMNPGFRADHVLICQIALPETQYRTKEAWEAFYRDSLDEIRALPGVVSASAVTAPPLGGHWGTFFTIENAPARRPDEQDPVVLQRVAFPGYFETMGIPMVAGRTFDDEDGRTEGARAVIVNETFARRFWPNQDPVGKRMRHRSASAPWMTVVGVARDVKHYGLDRPMIPGAYLPYVQERRSAMALVIRTAAEPLGLVSAVRDIVQRRDPDLPLSDVAAMSDRLHQSLWLRRLYSSLIGAFAAVALVMAVGGMYGVFSYVVGGRTQEIGVRLALGARGGSVLWLIVRQGLLLAALGIGIGLLGTLVAVPVTRRLLLGVHGIDLMICALAPLLLMGVALLACYLPARRAARIDPMAALRYE
jgi:predicted permease